MNYLAAAAVSQSLLIAAQPAGGFALANTAIGSQSSAQTVTLQFTTAGTLAATEVLTQGAASLDFRAASGGTCTAGTAYASDETCTVNVVFSPKYAGTRFGAVSLLNASGAPLATAYLQGTGLGPQLTFSPAVQSTIGSGLALPDGVAMDGNGNIYIAHYSNDQVYKETLSGGTYTQSSVGSGLSSPASVAVDGAGNLYIADSGNSRVVKETLSAGAYVGSPSRLAWRWMALGTSTLPTSPTIRSSSRRCPVALTPKAL